MLKADVTKLKTLFFLLHEGGGIVLPATSVHFSTLNNTLQVCPTRPEGTCELKRERSERTSRQASKEMARYRNVVFTWNNPSGEIEFEDGRMQYLVYQEEVGASGTYHFQGYCEFTSPVTHNTAKQMLGGPTVHIERRRGTQAQAIAYCKKDDTRIAHTEPIEEGTPHQQGKRVDLEGFKDAVFGGERKRDLVHDHVAILARYPKFYATLTELNRPRRSAAPVVTLLIGETGTGKTRHVVDRFGDDQDFWRSPLNNGKLWFDGYDGHSVVLLDDFCGRASSYPLCDLLQLLDRYTIQVPTKGGHTWWLPNEVFVTTNLLPRDWYDWKNRGEHYKALARRFSKVLVYFVPMPGTHCSFYEAVKH